MTAPGLTPEQKSLRSTRLTGSSIAGLLGRSPWDSPLEAWEYHTGRRDFAGNDDTEAGQFMESGIGKLTLHKMPIDPVRAETAVSPGTILHPEWPDVFAVTPDLIIESEQVGIQIKNHMPWASQRYKGPPDPQMRWHNTLLPDEKLMQCLLEMEVVSKHYGGDKWVWFLASYFGGSHLRVYWVHRDTTLMKAMVLLGLRFHRRHLDPAGPQDPPSPECTCGGCGRGSMWWIGQERVQAPRVKLTKDEVLLVPSPLKRERQRAPITDVSNAF